MRENTAFIKQIIIAVVVVIVVVAVFAVYHHKSHPPLPQAKSINTENQPMMGDPKASIHIVVFEDLKCANCARYSNEIFPQIKSKYIDSGTANYSMINLAFLPNSMPAANAARCAYAQNPKLFFAYVEKVYANQPPENVDWATIPQLSNFAAGIPDINLNAFTDCLVKSPYNQFIQDNLKIAASVMGEQIATPSLYINGILIRPMTMEKIDQTIRELE